MSNKLHNELKKEFQLERMILFSDAVFAIAITLLVIEIKIPEIPRAELTEQTVLHALGHLIPKFVGFFISFLVIGQYWIVHHRLFGFVVNFTDRLILLNILFLFAVAIMPFSTGFYSEYVTKRMVTPVVFYTANIALLGILNFLMWRYVSQPSLHLSENLTPPMVKYFSLRALVLPVIFTIVSFVYLFYPTKALWVPIFIAPVIRSFFRPLKKRITTTPN
jgi:uncharacterized membrane protein